MPAQDKLAGLRADWLGQQMNSFDHDMKQCESPIEQLLLGAFLVHGWRDAVMSEWQEVSHATKKLHHGVTHRHRAYVREDSEHALFIQPTVIIRGHRARFDFAFLGIYGEESGAPFRVGVEADGHDFHERTKKQASSDKARDRRHALNGWIVLRYTGSDIYADPLGVADEIFWALAGKQAGG